MDHDARARTRVTLATTAREVADLSRAVIGDVATPMRPGERIRTVRDVRMHALLMVDAAVAVELADGATWEQVAEALGWIHPDMDDAEVAVYVENARRKYGGRSPAPTGGGGDEYRPDADGDLQDQAVALDAYYVRHGDPWSTGGSASPVGDALRTFHGTP